MQHVIITHRQAEASLLPLKAKRVPSILCKHLSSKAELDHPEGSDTASPIARTVQSLCRKGQLKRAIDVLLSHPDCATCPPTLYISLLKACSKGKALLLVKQLHEFLDIHRIKLAGLLGDHLIIALASCGSLDDAQNALLSMPSRTVFSWTALISGHVGSGNHEEALKIFHQMQEDGVQPDQHTFVSLFQACGNMGDFQEGRKLHAAACMKGFTLDIFVNSALMGMYGKWGSIMEAENVFDGLPRHNVVSWSTMMSLYADQAQSEVALQFYRQMHEEGISPDGQTFVIVIQSCIGLLEQQVAVGNEDSKVKMACSEIGQAIHSDVLRLGFTSHDFVGNSLVNMHGKFGNLADAERIFKELLNPSIVAWSAMLSAYIMHGQGERALQLYRYMQKEGHALDDAASISILQACIETGSLETCRQLHFTITVAGYDPNLLLMNTLIRAYGSCISMVDAQAVFCGLCEPDVTSWNSFLAGYAQEGYQRTGLLDLSDEMHSTGVKPDIVTFLSLLSACNHAGLVDEAIACFDCMLGQYGIAPKLKHYVVLVDLLGRAGCFKRVESTLLGMPMHADLMVWLSVLNGCRMHDNVKLGKQAFMYVADLRPQDSSFYVLMSNICASDGLLGYATEDE